MTTLTCPHCRRLCAGPQGLAAHIRSMHADETSTPARPATEPGGGGASSRNGLVWEEPPPIRMGRSSEALTTIIATVPQLRDRPGSWARVYTWPVKNGAAAMKSRLAKHPLAGLAGIEFTARAMPPGSALYARAVESSSA